MCVHNEKNGDYNEFQVCLISYMNINYKENGGTKKAFAANLKHRCHASQWGEHEYSVIFKRMSIITSILV